MQTSKSRPSLVGQMRLFGNIRVLVIAALLVAMSIVFGKVLSFTIGPLRISFENLPILMAGIFFGPVIGMVVGIVADIIGCLIVGYAINPLITAGAACIGLFAGLMYYLPDWKKQEIRIVLTVLTAHVIGSMIVKSIGFMVYYGYPIESVALRVPLYLGITIVESIVLLALLRNKAFSRELERIQQK